MVKIESVVKNKLCISCGACTQIDGSMVVMQEKSSGIYEPIVTDRVDKKFDEAFNSICPGSGYDIEGIASNKFVDTSFVPELGQFLSIGASSSLSDSLLERASSGGVMTTLALYMIESEFVSGVIVTKMVGSRTKAFVAKNKDELISAQGSKYCPVASIDLEINLKEYPHGLAFIGTPCQVAAIEGLKTANQKDSNWVHQIKFTMANFCGGFRDLRETDLLIERSGFEKNEVSYFQYRGNGQPGEMLIRSRDREKRLSYPEYARGTGIVKYKRCRYCIDATGELADASFGDAWIPRFLQSERSWSLFIARSKSAVELINALSKQDLVLNQSVELNELIKSQIGNIATKKYRQRARFLLAEILRIKVPTFNDSRFQKLTSVLFEFKVSISHSAFYYLEKLRIYPLVAKLIKRYPEDLK